VLIPEPAFENFLLKDQIQLA